MRVWDIKTAKLLRTLGPFAHTIHAVAYGDAWRAESRACEEDDNASIWEDTTNTSLRPSNDPPAGSDNDGRFIYRPGIWVAHENFLEFFSMGLYK